MATRAGTWGYRDRFAHAMGRTYFRRFGPGVVSSVGLGTRPGPADDPTDARQRRAIERALATGINHVDTAPEYRDGRAERVVGEAVAATAVDRVALVVATKVGYLAGLDPAAVDVDAEHVVRADTRRAGTVHSLAPAVIDASLRRSHERLGLDTIDLCYVTDPGVQLAVHDRATVYDMLEAAFERLERRIAAGRLSGYGIAAWDCFSVPQQHPRYLSLPTVIERARRAAATVDRPATGFRALAVPFNVRAADAYTVASHVGAEGSQSVLRFAHAAELSVFAVAPLGRGALTTAGDAAIPTAVADRLAGDAPAQRAINFARSAPGVTSALVGTTVTAHVDEAVAAGTFAPMGARAFDATFE